MIEKDISDIIKGQEKVDLYIAIIDALNKQINDCYFTLQYQKNM